MIYGGMTSGSETFTVTHEFLHDCSIPEHASANAQA